MSSWLAQDFELYRILDRLKLYSVQLYLNNNRQLPENLTKVTFRVEILETLG